MPRSEVSKAFFTDVSPAHSGLRIATIATRRIRGAVSTWFRGSRRCLPYTQRRSMACGEGAEVPNYARGYRQCRWNKVQQAVFSGDLRVGADMRMVVCTSMYAHEDASLGLVCFIGSGGSSSQSSSMQCPRRLRPSTWSPSLARLCVSHPRIRWPKDHYTLQTRPQQVVEAIDTR